jgi:hypothetical protein
LGQQRSLSNRLDLHAYLDHLPIILVHLRHHK